MNLNPDLNILEVDILELLLQKRQLKFSEIAEALYPKYKQTYLKSAGKSKQRGKSAFKTLLAGKVLPCLIRKGLIQKRIYSVKNVQYKIPIGKRWDVSLEVKRHRIIQKIKEWPHEEIEKLFMLKIGEINP